MLIDFVQKFRFVLVIQTIAPSLYLGVEPT